VAWGAISVKELGWQFAARNARTTVRRLFEEVSQFTPLSRLYFICLSSFII
jgi:hypothetical protein